MQLILNSAILRDNLLAKLLGGKTAILFPSSECREAITSTLRAIGFLAYYLVNQFINYSSRTPIFKRGIASMRVDFLTGSFETSILARTCDRLRFSMADIRCGPWLLTPYAMLASATAR